MFLTSSKGINRLKKEINRLLSKRITRLRKKGYWVKEQIKLKKLKKLNRLLSKGMSNIYLKVTIERNWRSQKSIF